MAMKLQRNGNPQSSVAYFFKRIAPLSVMFLIGLASDVPTYGQSQSELPPGQYQYLGRTGKTTPKRFSINSEGIVHWDDTAVETKIGETTDTDAKPVVAAAEEYNYPLVKWKAKRLLGTAKAIGWLTSTYESGAVKYQIMIEVESGLIKSNDSVIKIAMKRGLTVELLDAGDFKIAELFIPGTVLHEAKESVLEGRGAIQMPEALYEKTRNITIR
jgi:hypothetical protein